jgi:putative restriction endonuclease
MNATSKALDRTSTHEARAVFEKLVPIHARDACADLFVDAIATAHSAGPDRWSVTLTAHSFGDRDMWRLNVGLIRVVWIAGKRVIVLVDTAAVSPATLSALRQLGDRSWQDPGEYYAHAPTCKEFAFDPQNISEAQRLFHDGLRSAIAIGSAEPLHHSASKAYSPGIIKALADLTGRDVPYPVGRPEASLLDLSPELTQGGARVDRVFGHLPGVPVGSAFANRQALHHAGVHRPLMSGISGAEEEGADSIVVSGGYEDDEDYGHYIVYTGQGGNDPATRQQVADQTLTRGNLALARSSVEGLPVRVIRGAGGDPMHSPPQGFRYDGLFSVQSYWQDVGKSGFVVYPLPA